MRAPTAHPGPTLSEIAQMAATSYRSPNPALARGFGKTASLVEGDAVMTLPGTVVKTAVLLGVLVAAAAYGWSLSDVSVGAVLLAVFAALGVAVVVTIKPKLSPYLAPLYAVLEGVAVGFVSRLYAGGEVYVGAGGSGIVISAVGLTVCIFVALLVAYASGLIHPSENFRLGVASATGGICLYYMASIAFGAFGRELPFIWSNGTGGIIFSVMVVILAAANLVLDFDFIERGVAGRAPKHMEWFAAFGLLVTLVWLYLELLRLLAKSKSRR